MSKVSIHPSFNSGKSRRVIGWTRWVGLVALLIAGTTAGSGQTTRPRRTDTPQPAPTATPYPSATPATPTTQPTPYVNPNLSPYATPYPNPTPPAPTPPPTATAPNSVAELQTQLTQIVRQPAAANGLVGIKVMSLDTGRTLFEDNANKSVTPASSMKIFTVATALGKLSPDYRFRTSVYVNNRPDASGTITGDLTLVGRGDPSLAIRFTGGTYSTAIDDLANRVAATGVRRITGDVVGDENYLSGDPVPEGWQWDDLQWYYGAEVSALTVNDNSLDLIIKPAARVGDPVDVRFGPPLPVPTHFAIINQMTTVGRGGPQLIKVHRPVGADYIEVSGTMPQGDEGYMGSVAVPKPALVFTQMLRQALEQRGIRIDGRTRLALPRLVPIQYGQPTEIAYRLSPPLSEIIAQTLKPSQNLYTELLLRTTGEEMRRQLGRTTEQTSAELGLDAVKGFLYAAGVSDQSALRQVDGSGLSRLDLVTADSAVKLLTYMTRHRYSQVFYNALPIAGVDGTLRGRLRNTPAYNNMHAKTGTLTGVHSLCGYVTTAAGERLVFAIFVNNIGDDKDPRKLIIDPVATALASLRARP